MQYFSCNHSLFKLLQNAAFWIDCCNPPPPPPLWVIPIFVICLLFYHPILGIVVCMECAWVGVCVGGWGGVELWTCYQLITVWKLLPVRVARENKIAKTFLIVYFCMKRNYVFSSHFRKWKNPENKINEQFRPNTTAHFSFCRMLGNVEERK